MTRIALAALLLLAANVQPAFAQNPPSSSPEALNWLQKIAAAPRRYNYIGTFVYSSNGDIETSRIVHLVNEEGEHEKSEVLDGAPREIIRNNDEMRCYLAGEQDHRYRKTLAEKSFSRTSAAAAQQSE